MTSRHHSASERGWNGQSLSAGLITSLSFLRFTDSRVRFRCARQALGVRRFVDLIKSVNLLFVNLIKLPLLPVGNGMRIQGLKGGTMRTCLKKDPNIPLCVTKYEVPTKARNSPIS